MNRLFVVVALSASPVMVFAQPAAAPASVAVTLSEWKVVMARDTVKAGPITFRVKNTGVMTHGVYVTGDGIDKGSREIPAGQEGSLTVTLKPGTYEVYCPMSDLSHKMAGMTRKLIVTPSAAPAAPKKPGV